MGACGTFPLAASLRSATMPLPVAFRSHAVPLILLAVFPEQAWRAHSRNTRSRPASLAGRGAPHGLVAEVLPTVREGP